MNYLGYQRLSGPYPCHGTCVAVSTTTTAGPREENMILTVLVPLPLIEKQPLDNTHMFKLLSSMYTNTHLYPSM